MLRLARVCYYIIDIAIMYVKESPENLAFHLR